MLATVRLRSPKSMFIIWVETWVILSMARSINRLSPRKVATEAKRGLYADGGGLYLQVSRFDTKSWAVSYTHLTLPTNREV